MSIAKRHSGGATRFQSTRRTSGKDSEDEGSASQAACVEPDRTFGRTYLSRGMSGYKRPKRPGRSPNYGKKTWSADDPLPNVSRPSPGERNEAIPTGTKETVVPMVQQRGGCRKTPARGSRAAVVAAAPVTDEEK